MIPPGPVENPLHAEFRCEVCGTDEGLRVAPLMRHLDPPVICVACMTAWYESGETTREGILKAKEVLASSADAMEKEHE